MLLIVIERKIQSFFGLMMSWSKASEPLFHRNAIQDGIESDLQHCAFDYVSSGVVFVGVRRDSLTRLPDFNICIDKIYSHYGGVGSCLYLATIWSREDMGL